MKPRQDLIEFAKEAMARHETMQAATRREQSSAPAVEIRRTSIEMEPPKGFADTPQKSRKPLDQVQQLTEVRRALQIHSRSEDDDVYVGVGPYGNLWDALVSGDLTVVDIDGRLADPSDPDDTGWMLIDSGENLYLLCEITNGDISAASLEIGTSSALCSFSSYTQSSFRVPLARGETVDSNVVVVTLHEGELVANFEVISGKSAKYAR